MGATEKLASVYDKLEKSMKPTQSKALDSRGFAFLDMDQINKVYKDPGLFYRMAVPRSYSIAALNVPEEAMDFDAYARLSADQREESLWKTIEKIAINKPEVFCCNTSPLHSHNYRNHSTKTPQNTDE